LWTRKRKGICSFWMPRARMVLSRFLKRSGSIPAEEQTALKSFLSSNRNCSALRLKVSGPEIHSSSVLVMTARQSLSSAVPLSRICNNELLNMADAPVHLFLTGRTDQCSWMTRTPSNSMRSRGLTKHLRRFGPDDSEYTRFHCLAPCLFSHQGFPEGLKARSDADD
jgi:hypothetical protein